MPENSTELKALLRAIVPARLRLKLYEARFQLWRRTAGRNARLERPIFMIGCPRSGTTIAVRTLALHPDMADLSEAPEIWDPRNFRNVQADHHWTAADVAATDAARLHARFEHFRRHQGKARFINKHPRSSVRIDYIRAVFPDAVFIHVLRDPRAVVASMLEGNKRLRQLVSRRGALMLYCHPPGWRELLRDDLTEQVALQARAIVRYVLDKRAELGPAYHAFKYEDFCADPRGVLGTAFRFAGLRVDDSILARLPERLESQNYKWKTQLAPEQIETINRLHAPLLAELGYPL